MSSFIEELRVHALSGQEKFLRENKPLIDEIEERLTERAKTHGDIHARMCVSSEERLNVEKLMKILTSKGGRFEGLKYNFWFHGSEEYFDYNLVITGPEINTKH